METIYRKAVSADAPAIARLLVLAWQKAYRGILSDAFLDAIHVDQRVGRIRSGMETKPDSHYYVLEADGEIVGVTVFCPARDADLTDTMEIAVFYIQPDRQRQGLGRVLMQKTLAKIQVSGCKRVSLWVLKENHSARAFYEKMGFQTDGHDRILTELENTAAVRYRHTIQE